MDLRHLQHFLVAARHGSLRRSAEAAGISQPALTKSIHRLEASLEVPLFERSSRGIRLTEFGEALVLHARALDVEFRLAREAIQGMRSTARGVIKVGAGPSMSVSLLPVLTERLLGQSEDVRIEAYPGLNDTLLAALEAGTIDFAITSLAAGSSVPSTIAQERLFTDRVVVAGREQHPLAGRDVEAKELLAYRWLLPDRNVLTRLYLDEFFLRRDLPLPTIWAETNSIHYILETVGRTDLLSYVPLLLLAGKPLTTIRASGPVWRRSVGISYWRRRTMTPASLLFLKVLREVARELHGG
ncbi:MAG: LysR substrate-binding domain-containing protein [Rhodospirillales bacterium]|nr:LysR substrate-binding domain-containing protein [Rhodospirillales bacterium]